MASIYDEKPTTGDMMAGRKPKQAQDRLAYMESADPAREQALGQILTMGQYGADELAKTPTPGAQKGRRRRRPKKRGKMGPRDLEAQIERQLNRDPKKVAEVWGRLIDEHGIMGSQGAMVPTNTVGSVEQLALQQGQAAPQMRPAVQGGTAPLPAGADAMRPEEALAYAQPAGTLQRNAIVGPHYIPQQAQSMLPQGFSGWDTATLSKDPEAQVLLRMMIRQAQQDQQRAQAAQGGGV